MGESSAKTDFIIPQSSDVNSIGRTRIHEAPAKIAYTLSQACEVTGIGRTKMYEFMNAGLVKPKKSGRNNIFTAEQLRKLVDSLPEK